MHTARRAAVLSEVILAFVVVHVAFRAIKRFTIMGKTARNLAAWAVVSHAKDARLGGSALITRMTTLGS